MPKIGIITLCQQSWIYIFFLLLIQNKYFSVHWWKILLHFIFPSDRKIKNLYSIWTHRQPHHTCRPNCKLFLLLRPGRFNIIAGYNIIISHTHSYKIILVHTAGELIFPFYGVLYFTIAWHIFRCQYFNKTIIAKWLGFPNPPP